MAYPSWAEARVDGKIHVNVNQAYPWYLEKMGLGADLYGVAMARHMCIRDITMLAQPEMPEGVRPTIHLECPDEDRQKWSFADLQPDAVIRDVVLKKVGKDRQKMAQKIDKYRAMAAMAGGIM